MVIIMDKLTQSHNQIKEAKAFKLEQGVKK